MNLKTPTKATVTRRLSPRKGERAASLPVKPRKAVEEGKPPIKKNHPPPPTMEDTVKHRSAAPQRPTTPWGRRPIAEKHY